ncbi:MAG: hypothetical protein HQM09_13420, partial [Candidatus Riflebacteria bacterium]|nr:hypothetical protein [Candidatus Riflebacteria bacterium]
MLEMIRIETTGIPVNVPGMQEKITELQPRLNELEQAFVVKGINPRSSKIMLKHLQDRGFTRDSTDKEVLFPFGHDPEIAELIEIREIAPKLSFWKKVWPTSGTA